MEWKPNRNFRATGMIAMLAMFAGCDFGGPEKDGEIYTLSSVSGTAYSYKGGAVVDSFPLPESFKRYYLDSIDAGSFENIRIETQGGRFKAYLKINRPYERVDTVFEGETSPIDSEYLALTKELPCGAMRDGLKTISTCFSKDGNELVFHVCAEILYWEASFPDREIMSEAKQGFTNRFGVDCSGRQFPSNSQVMDITMRYR
jgi:hypothetical protein